MEKIFGLEDVIVWEGVITKYNVIKDLVNLKDKDVDIRRANQEEIIRYHNRPEK